MISISIDDSACVAVGPSGRSHAVCSDVVWTDAGWIVADMADAGKLLEAVTSGGLGKVYGFSEALGLADDATPTTVHYLAVLFKRAATALLERGEKDVDDVTIAIPALAVRREASNVPGEVNLYSLELRSAKTRQTFVRAAQLAGFKRVSVQTAAIGLAERHRKKLKLDLTYASSRICVVEVFRNGFSMVPVNSPTEGHPLEAAGQTLFIEYDVEDAAFGALTSGLGDAFRQLEANDVKAALRASHATSKPPRLSALPRGSVSLIDLDARFAETIAMESDFSVLSNTNIQRLLAPKDKSQPEYVQIVISGWLAASLFLQEAFKRQLQIALYRHNAVNAPPVAVEAGLVGSAEGAGEMAGLLPNWVVAAPAHELRAIRKSPENKQVRWSEALPIGGEFITVPGTKRPSLGRLSWLANEEPRPTAVITVHGADGEYSRYEAVFQLQRWETKGRVEAELTLEHDDRVCLSTLVDGRPAPAQVTRVQAGGSSEPLRAFSPGKFELHLNDEHKVITQMTRLFERGSEGTIAVFNGA